jgi:hypothetical protein
MRKLFFISILLLVTLVVSASAQTPADSLFHVAQIAYDNGDFEGAEVAALRGLRSAEQLDEFGQLKFHLLLGFVYVAKEQKGVALQEFTRVVVTNPAYELDPVQISPKIVEVFREAKKVYMDRIMSEPEVYRMPQADVRMAASWRSAVLPGWGQFYKKQDVKGAALASAQLVSLAALIFMQIEVNGRHNDYLDKKTYFDPTVETAYSEYRRSWQTRNVVGYVTLGIYLVNYLDALYTPVFHKKTRNEK